MTDCQNCGGELRLSREMILAPWSAIGYQMAMMFKMLYQRKGRAFTLQCSSCGSHEVECEDCKSRKQTVASLKRMSDFYCSNCKSTKYIE